MFDFPSETRNYWVPSVIVLVWVMAVYGLPGPTTRWTLLSVIGGNSFNKCNTHHVG